MYVIAEMSGNHNQNIDLAMEIVAAAARSGANAIKTQAYDPDELTIDCNNDYFMINHAVWGGQSLYELYKKAYTPWQWHEPLKEEAERLGMDYISTAYDLKGAEFLLDLGLKKVKIASFEMTYLRLVDYLVKNNAELLISTGMAEDWEIKKVMDRVPENTVFFHCTSAYPSPSSAMELHRISDIVEYGFVAGLSDHSLGDTAALLSMGLGASVLEKHFMLNDQPETVDSHFSMSEREFSVMVSKIRDAENMLLTSKTRNNEQKSSMMFRRSLFVTDDIETGDIITDKNVRVIRPGYGGHPFRYDDIIGTRAIRNYKRGEPYAD